MTASRSQIRSAFMEWAKLESQGRFNLARSDLEDFRLADLPVKLEDLEITGPSFYGYAPLQERLARKCGVPEACVVAATGTSMANHLALAAVVEAGAEVLIEEPTYEPLLRTAQYLGAGIRRLARRFEEGFRVDPDEVERAMTPRTRAIVLTDLHNPSGVRTAEETFSRIAAIANGQGAYVIVDEVYLEACLDPAVRSSFHPASNVITTCSLTKAYGLSGLRCGWVLAPAPLAERMWRINDLYGSTPAHPAERLSVIALDHLDEIAARARGILGTNRPALDRFLDSRPELEAVRAPSGTVVFPRLAGGRVDNFCRLLRDRYETTVVPGRFFGMPDHFRIGIGGDPLMVEEGLVRLGRALDERDR